MRTTVSGSTFALWLLLAACSRTPAPGQRDAQKLPETQKVVEGEGQGEATQAQVGPNPAGPVEVGPPNVPEFKPAFPGQTRAPAVHTRTAIQVTEVAEDFDEPWALAFLPDGRMFVTEKHDGELFVVTARGAKSEPVSGIPKVDGRDQGGLLDVELDPDYAKNQLVYLSYYEPREGGNGLAVARARFVDGPQPKLDAPKVIFRMQPTLDSTMHAGGRLVFAPDGMLFVTLGERSILKGRVQARELGSDFGKIVRIRPDGTVPPDNPFTGKPGARPEIWSLGHRNVLGADLDDKQRLWVAEMGPKGGDELNLVMPGKDYGWPKIGYGEEYSGKRIHETTQAPGLEQPAYYWDPVISPGALAIYSGDLFKEWNGNFLIAGLSSKALIRLVLKDDRVVGEERLLTERGDRIREVVQGPDGAVYLLTDGGDGALLKLTPGAGTR
ncbi:MAG TPA: PQQ-dependent sugar dehydrogenase [Polyangiaceae bacterium]